MQVLVLAGVRIYCFLHDGSWASSVFALVQRCSLNRLRLLHPILMLLGMVRVDQKRFAEVCRGLGDTLCATRDRTARYKLTSYLEVHGLGSCGQENARQRESPSIKSRSISRLLMLRFVNDQSGRF